MCCTRVWDWYWVITPIRRIPELMQLDSAKSIMRNLPPKCTAGFARLLVKSFRRVPRPPASIRATDFNGSWRANITRSFFSKLTMINSFFILSGTHTVHAQVPARPPLSPDYPLQRMGERRAIPLRVKLYLSPQAWHLSQSENGPTTEFASA